jgi:hypothetical protein
MRYATLPSKNSKDEPNVVAITNRKLDETLEGGTKFEINAERFSYPQFDSIEEFVQSAGSDARALEIINDNARDVAVAAGKNYIRTATKGTHDEIVDAGISASKNYSFVKSENLTAKEAKDALTSLKADISNLSEADIAKRVRELLGISI